MPNGNGANSTGSRLPPELEGDERLKNIEPRMVEMIMNEVCVCVCVRACVCVCVCACVHVYKLSFLCILFTPDHGSWGSCTVGRYSWPAVCQEHHQRDCDISHVKTVSLLHGRTLLYVLRYSTEIVILGAQNYYMCLILHKDSYIGGSKYFSVSRHGPDII